VKIFMEFKQAVTFLTKVT